MLPVYLLEQSSAGKEMLDETLSVAEPEERQLFAGAGAEVFWAGSYKEPFDDSFVFRKHEKFAKTRKLMIFFLKYIGRNWSELKI
jgi:hypothetical protein